MEPEPEMLSAMEELFMQTDSIVLAAIKVGKLHHSGDSTGAQLLKALGAKQTYDQDSMQPRLLVFTVKRSMSDRGFKASMHICKPSQSAVGFQIRKSYSLKYLEYVKVLTQKYEHREQRFIEMRIGTHHNVSETRAEFGLENTDSMFLLMSVIVQLLRQQDCKLPELSGITVGQIDAWWAGNREQAAKCLTEFASEVITPGAALAKTDHSSVLVSAKEERDLEELLDMFAMGIGDAEEFQDRLQDEFSALEAANVHAILESVPLVEGVIYQLRMACNVLEDLDESLKVFDFKLRHMREDIAAIEACNNTLELQARNNAKLLATLQGLVSDLALDQDTTWVLEAASLTPDKLPALTAAGWALHTKLQRLGTSADCAISYQLQDMRVVREAWGTISKLAAQFVQRCSSSIISTFNQVADDMMSEMGRGADRSSRMRPPSFARAQEVLRRYSELLRVLHSLDPSAFTKVQMSFASSMSTVIRKAMRASVSELRRSVGAAESSTSGASGPLEGLSASASNSFSSNRGRGAGSEAGGDSMSEVSDGYSMEGSPTTGKQRSRRTRAISMDFGPTQSLADAWQQLLDSYMPFLSEAAGQAAQSLLLYQPGGGWDASGQRAEQTSASRKGTGRTAGGAADDGPALSAEGRAALEQLLAGVDAELMVLSDMAGKNQHVMCVPMLAVTNKWLDATSGRSIAAVLHKALRGCSDKLTATFKAFVQSQVAAVEGFDSKSSMFSSGLKGIHTVPFVSQFCQLAHQMESLLQGCSGEGSVHGSPRGRGDAPPGSPSAAISRVRSEVDGVYGELAGRLFSSLERLAASDPKYGDRLRLENYGYFVESVRPLVRANVAALDSFRRQAEARSEQAMQSYVQQQLEYGKLWKLLEFSERVEKLLQVVSPPEVAYQNSCSANEVRKLVADTMQGADKKLDAMHQRIRKQLGSPALVLRVWERLQEALLQRYGQLAAQLEACYPGQALKPSTAELRELLKAAA